jgi:hypothetical protein
MCKEIRSLRFDERAECPLASDQRASEGWLFSRKGIMSAGLNCGPRQWLPVAFGGAID